MFSIFVQMDKSEQTVSVSVVELYDGSTIERPDSIAESVGSHDEPHFGNADIVRDIIIGLSDGLTVPFALAAGLSTLESSRIVLTAGIAEVVAGSISMALGGYLAGLSEIEHYDSERKREQWEIIHLPHREEQEIVEIFEPYGLPKQSLEPLMDHLRRNTEIWVDFMMKFELNLERPEPSRSYISALTIGSSYFLGGVVPLFPYAIFANANTALMVSAITTVCALFIFGFVKARLLGQGKPFLSAIQMAFIGSVAAASAYGVAQLIPQ
jgi:VIT1/CCC1 family predicted Fe2+/Mn2+ transporter